jgi:pilus assembly protein CpaE
VLEHLQKSHDLVVVDAWPWFNDMTLTVLDVSDLILTVFTLEITSIKNLRLFFEVADQLGYENGKVKLVLNRADSTLGIRVADVEHSIGRKVDHSIVSDGRTVVYALNRGVPVVTGNRETLVSHDILKLARAVCGEQIEHRAAKTQQPARRSLFAWR